MGSFASTVNLGQLVFVKGTNREAQRVLSSTREPQAPKACRECGRPTTNLSGYHFGCTPAETYLGSIFR